MKILYDHQIFDYQRYGGISRCFVELYRHLPLGCNAKISAMESENAYLLESGISRPVGFYLKNFILPFHWPYKNKMFTAYNRMIGRGREYHVDYKRYNKTESIRLLKKGNFDVFHPTFFDDYFLPYLNGKPFVLTIHDMIPEIYPQYFGKDDFQIVMKRKLATLANAIIAVSENTKRDIVKILNIPEEKVHVVYHGCSLPEMKSCSRVFHFPYILYIGVRWAYKNFVPFVKSLASILQEHKEMMVVCTGISFDETENKLFTELGLNGRFIHKWVEDDEELFSLYHHALCFVYPSSYEGFGIPILEAYKANCLVMLNNTSCFPEIAGDAAIYFEMTATSSNFKQKFEQLYAMNDDERKSLLVKQQSRLNHYSWEKSAQQLADIYYSVLS